MSASFHSFLPALAGGVCIGLASLLALLATGKVPGISGIFSRVLRPQKGDTAWRVVFLLGLVAGAGGAFVWIAPAAVYRPDASLAWFVVAGVLVGFGTRLGGGCTSGHGVCGIGMGSKSAVMATVVFMVVAMITVYVLRHGPWRVLP
jgi:uncharacterized membrane protein YedE/YeeE